MANRTSKPNRLAAARSVYLQQHAHDPVDWYPWGPEAFAKARQESKPIFLSIGYAACHWCHVMQRESFADPRVAAFLNEHFVPVKVDRQERPDVDELYMEMADAAGGRVGWPLNMVLSPEGVPLVSGTYFPPQRLGDYASFMEFLQLGLQSWGNLRRAGSREEVAQAAREVMGKLHCPQPGKLDVKGAETLAVINLQKALDREWGGFGGPPKFPTPAKLFFLLEQVTRGNLMAAGPLRITLESMAFGGFLDELGGGFHRYSVDQYWFVPHYEKMLPDNALLARLYLEAGYRLKRPDFREVAQRTLGFLAEKLYILRVVESPQEAEVCAWFAAGLDADTGGVEGATYTFTWEQLEALLSPEELRLLPEVSWFDPTYGRDTPLPVRLFPPDPAEPLPFPLKEAAELYLSIREKLLAARAQRPDPPLDTLDVTAWNGMAVWALDYRRAASSGGTRWEPLDATVLLRAVTRYWKVPRNCLAGTASGPETLEDLAWTLAALLESYQATGKLELLATAVELARERVPHYRGPQGVLYTTPDDEEKLLYRRRSLGDGAHLDPEAWMVHVLLRLGLCTANPDLSRWAEAALGAASGKLRSNPEEHCTWLLAARLALEQRVLVIAGDRRWPSTRKLLQAAYRSPVPPQVLVCPSSWPPEEEHLALVPHLAGKNPAGPEQAAAYLCTGNTCLAPVSDPKALARLLLQTAQPWGVT